MRAVGYRGFAAPRLVPGCNVVQDAAERALAQSLLTSWDRDTELLARTDRQLYAIQEDLCTPRRLATPFTSPPGDGVAGPDVHHRGGRANSPFSSIVP